MNNTTYIKGLVSIITPTYNSAAFVKETVNSILSQTYTNWELILVDDCSSDSSFQMISELAKSDNRIQAHRSLKNVGPGEIRNIALSYSTGQYIAFLDSDDLWSPDKLSTQIEFMKQGGYSITYTEYELLNEKGVSMNKFVRVLPYPLTLNKYLSNTVIGCSTAIIDRFKVDNVVFKPMKSRVDTLLWITLLKQGHTAIGLNKVLARYRIHSNSVSANKYKAAKKVWSLYRDELNMNLFKSSFYFSQYAFKAFAKRFI